MIKGAKFLNGDAPKKTVLSFTLLEVSLRSKNLLTLWYLLIFGLSQEVLFTVNKHKFLLGLPR